MLFYQDTENWERNTYNKVKSSVLTMLSGRCLLVTQMEIAGTQLELEGWLSGKERVQP